MNLILMNLIVLNLFLTCFWFGVQVETKGCSNRETWLNRGPAVDGGRAFSRAVSTEKRTLKKVLLRPRTPKEAFFHQNTKLSGLGRQFGWISFGAYGVFSANLSAPI